MKYNNLPGSDLKVSKICLGTMTFGEQNTEQEAHNQLDYALDHGVNFMDTAELYAVPSTASNNGLTEDYIGTWIKKSGKRDKYIIATKVTGPSKNHNYISDNLGFSAERINEAIDRSLRRLQTDYVDLYQLHWPERNSNFFGKLGYEHDFNEQWKDNIAEVVDTLNSLIIKGKIRHYGLSNESGWGAMRFLQEADKAELKRPSTIQNPYSLLNRSYEVALAEISMRENIGCLPYSPLGMGILSGKYHRNADTPNDRLNKYKYFSRYSAPHIYDITEMYLRVAEKHNLSLAQMALAFVNDRPFVTSNIIGATNLDQLAENIASASITLSEEVLKDIEDIHRKYSNPAP